jgi:TonB family protein
VVGVSGLDSMPRLRTRLDAPSNQYAQQCGVAGMALYRAVVGADGLPQEIAVVRPIGFGLDETAVSAIRAARFDPAMQYGKRVPVLIDFIVEFRIYSKRTDVAPANSAETSAPAALPAAVGAGRSATN